MEKRSKIGMLKKNPDDTLSITFGGLKHVEKLINGDYKR
jgi:hypothetical protein